MAADILRKPESKISEEKWRVFEGVKINAEDIKTKNWPAKISFRIRGLASNFGAEQKKNLKFIWCVQSC